MVIRGAFEHAHGRLCTSPSFVHPCILCHARGHTDTERQKRQRNRDNDREPDHPCPSVPITSQWNFVLWERLRNEGLSLDERVMPRVADATSKELDEKEAASWKPDGRSCDP